MAFLEVDVVSELSVDDSFGELLRINMDVTFLDLPCAYVSVDAMDISGLFLFSYYCWLLLFVVMLLLFIVVCCC